MNKNDRDIYIRRYNERYASFGYSPKTLGWNQGQNYRFSALTGVGINAHSSILDVGCGFGDFFGYLKNHQWSGKYLGVDINPQLLTEAKKQWPEIEVKQLDILEDPIKDQFDFVVSSGVFNAKLKHEENLQYIQAMLKKMFSLCKVGLAVDFFSTYVDFENELAFHVAPEDIFKFSKTLSRRVSLRHDYMAYEFCVYIFRDESKGPTNEFSAASEKPLLPMKG